MPVENFISVTGMILNITKGNDCCSRMLSLRTGNGIVNIVLDAQTQVIDDRQLRVGMSITAFYDGNSPAPLIFPPQFRARIIAVPGRNEQVMLNYFDRNLLAADGSLQLNIGNNTNIRTINGQNFNCSPAAHTLLVFYGATTRSIPPQTTPARIIVLC